MKKVNQRTHKKTNMWLKIISLSITGIFVSLGTFIIIVSCTAGVDVGGADRVLTSFDVEWPGDFNGECGSTYPVSVSINAYDQYGSVIEWAGLVSIIVTNTNITPIPTQVQIVDGTASVELEFRHSSESEEITNITLSNGEIATTLSDGITVYPNVTGVILNETDISLIGTNDTYLLTVSITPDNAWNQTVEWSTDDENVADVDETGLVTSIDYGTAVVTVTTDDGGFNSSCDVEVGIVRWHTMLGGSNQDYGYSVQQTTDGGFVVAGKSNSTDIDTLVDPDLIQSNQGLEDFYVVKLESAGSISWQTMIGGSNSDDGRFIQQTADDGFIIVGNSNSTDIDTLVDPDLIQGNNGIDDFYVVKLDSSGSISWHTMLGGNFTDIGRSIQQTTDDGYIVAGMSSSTNIDALIDPDLIQGNNGGDDFYVVKLDSSADITWHTMLGGGGDDEANSILQTGEGGYIVVGYSSSTNISTLIEPDLLQENHSGYDFYVVKLDSSGDISWHTMLGGSGSDFGGSIQQTTDNGYIVAGYSSSTNIANLLQGNHGGADFYIVKLDSSGSISWHTMVGGSGDDNPVSILQTTDNGYVVVGFSYSTNISDLIQEHHGGDSDIYVVKLDSSGSISWHTMLGGAGNEDGYSIQQTGSGEYIGAGYSSSTDITGLLLDNQGSNDFYVLKLW